MPKYTIADQPRLLNDLIGALTQAAGASTQMLHHHKDPRWFQIRDGLEQAKDNVTKLATVAASRTTLVRPA